MAPAEVELGVVTGYVVGPAENEELLSLLLPLKLAHHAKALDALGFSAETARVTKEADLEAVGLKPLETRLLLAAARDATAASSATAFASHATATTVPPGQEVWGAVPPFQGPKSRPERLIVRVKLAPTDFAKTNDPLVAFNAGDLTALHEALDTREGGTVSGAKVQAIEVLGTVYKADEDPFKRQLERAQRFETHNWAVVAAACVGACMGVLIGSLGIRMFDMSLEQRRQVNLEARLEALNTQLLSPAGCYTKFGSLFQKTVYHNGNFTVVPGDSWLAVATTPEEVAALRIEPAFWQLRSPDYFLTKEVEELLRRTAANPRIPIVAVAPEGDYENFRFYWAGRNWTRIV